MEVLERKTEQIYPGSFSCPGCSLNLAYRHVLSELGSNTVVVTSAGCGSVVAGYYPATTSKVPFFHCSFGTAAATAAGLRAGLDMQGRADTRVVAWAGDGGTFDIGLQSLSGAAERNDDILYVCYDNEAYMNTGVQRSSATPLGSWTTTTPFASTEDRPKKDMTAIVAAHGVPYIAAACVSFPEDLRKKVRTAAGMKGFRFIHILVPCPTGWLHAAKDTVKMGRLAVLSRVFSLYEIFNGRDYRLSPMGAKIPVTEYLSGQGRFKGLTPEQQEIIQRDVDRQWKRLQGLAGGDEGGAS